MRRRLWLFLRKPPIHGATFAGSGELVAGATLNLQTSSTLPGTGDLTGSIALSIAHGVTFSGSGSLVASSVHVTPGASFEGSGDLTGSPVLMLRLSAVCAGAGDLAGGLSNGIPLAMSVAGTGTLVALPAIAIEAGASLTGSGNLMGDVVAGNVFRLYVRRSDGSLHLRRTLDGTLRTFDLAGLLGAGVWRLVLSRVDAYGSESDVTDPRSQLTVTVDSGGTVSAAMIDPTQVRARAIAGGEIELTWLAIPSRLSGAPGGGVNAAEYEIADAADLGTILETITAGRRRLFVVQTDGGAFTDGNTVRLAVRASDGEVSGARGAWVYASAVAVDASGPTPAPEVIATS